MLTPPLLRLFFNLTLIQIIQNLDVRQVIFIHSENETSIDQTIFSQLSSGIPTLQVNLVNQTLKLNQSSALFIWTKDPWSSPDIELQQVRQLRLMSINTFQSKFLVLQKDDDHCESLLQLAWSELILDFTILDPHQLHYYNPFTKKYFHSPYNISTNFFPDKLLNLHLHPLKVGIVDYPPYSSVKNDKNYGYEYIYVFGELLHCLSTAANFVVEPDVVTMPGYGVLDGKTGTATGLIGKVMRAEIDFVAFAAFLFFSEFNSKTDRTTYIIIEQGCAVVPVIPLENPHLLLAESLQVSFTIILILVVVVYVSSLFLRLGKRLWHPLHVLFLILGISVSNVPKTLRERFLYGCIMVVSLFYSSNIFAQLTNINMATTSYLPFESYEDLDKSGLVPVIHPNLMNFTFKSSDDEFLTSLGNKAQPRFDLVTCCPNWLTNNKNVSCVFEGHLAGLQVKLHKDSEGKDTTKIAQPCFWHVTRSFLLPRTSPYTERFNRIIRRVEQAGLQGWWEVQASFEYKRSQNVSLDEEGNIGNDILADKGKLKDMLKDDTHKSARYFVVLGNLGATCVFIGELVVFRVKRWKTRAKVIAYNE